MVEFNYRSVNCLNCRHLVHGFRYNRCGNYSCKHTDEIVTDRNICKDYSANVDMVGVFFDEYMRMCNSYEYCSGGCPVRKIIDKYGKYVGNCMDDFVRYHVDEVKDTVKQWSEEHPIEFLSDICE